MAALRCNNPQCKVVIGGLTPDGGNVSDWWPRDFSGKEFPDVPEVIGDAASEAHTCLQVGAIRAAIAIARSVVEATAKDKGITSGTLEKKIDGLVSQGILSQDTADAAHAVRLWGNDAAHGDLAQERVEHADAEEVVALMDEVLVRVYQSPARTARIVASREARKQGRTGGVADV